MAGSRNLSDRKIRMGMHSQTQCNLVSNTGDDLKNVLAQILLSKPAVAKTSVDGGQFHVAFRDTLWRVVGASTIVSRDQEPRFSG